MKPKKKVDEANEWMNVMKRAVDSRKAALNAEKAAKTTVNAATNAYYDADAAVKKGRKGAAALKKAEEKKAAAKAKLTAAEDIAQKARDDAKDAKNEVERIRYHVNVSANGDPEELLKAAVATANKLNAAATKAQEAATEAAKESQSAIKLAVAAKKVVNEAYEAAKGKQPYEAARIIADRLRELLGGDDLGVGYLHAIASNIRERISKVLGNEGLPVTRPGAAAAAGGDPGTTAGTSPTLVANATSGVHDTDVPMDSSSTVASGVGHGTTATPVHSSSGTSASGVSQYHCANCNCTIKYCYQYKKTGLCKNCMQLIPKNMMKNMDTSPTNSLYTPIDRNSYPLKPTSLLPLPSANPSDYYNAVLTEADYDSDPKYMPRPSDATNNASNSKSKKAVLFAGANSQKGAARQAKFEAMKAAEAGENVNKGNTKKRRKVDGGKDAEQDDGDDSDAENDGSSLPNRSLNRSVQRSKKKLLILHRC